MNHSDVDFLAKHLFQIGYGLLALASTLLVGAIKIAFDLMQEYKTTKQALKKQAEKIN